jgi:hypothetical protein
MVTPASIRVLAKMCQAHGVGEGFSSLYKHPQFLVVPAEGHLTTSHHLD